VTTTRDFTFVEDTCRGLQAIAGLGSGLGEVFNIGANQEISIGDLFRLIAEIMCSDAHIESDPQRFRPAKSEVRQLRCNGQKLRDAQGYQPQISLREGLRQTIDWFQNPTNLRCYKQSLYNV
jgi:nucleoside-diphosphate-sugar epimerase